MSLIHHVVIGSGKPPVVFVHGFGCSHTDWAAQMAHLAPRYGTVAVDLRGHGASPGTAEDCSIERYGADVVEVMRALALPPAVLVGHSMGCRVVVEATLQAPEHSAAVVLVDGSQFAAGMAAVMQARFAEPEGYATFVHGLFKDMFTVKTHPLVATSGIERARRLPRPIGEKMLADLVRYDVGRFGGSLASLAVPVMAVQTTYSNENRQRQSLREGQSTPYLDMLRATVQSLRVEIIPDTGHFPQLDETARMNTLLDRFLARL